MRSDGEQTASVVGWGGEGGGGGGGGTDGLRTGKR